MKWMASNNCLATDHSCTSRLFISVSQVPAIGIDITLPLRTSQIATPVMMWFEVGLIPVRYRKISISPRPSCTNFRYMLSHTAVAEGELTAARAHYSVQSVLTLLLLLPLLHQAGRHAEGFNAPNLRYI
jgi:hypothetical protein